MNGSVVAGAAISVQARSNPRSALEVRPRKRGRACERMNQAAAEGRGSAAVAQEVIVIGSDTETDDDDDEVVITGVSYRAQSSDDEDRAPFCDICGETIAEPSYRAHQTSMLHVFNQQHPEQVHFGIPASNRGYKLLQKLGWDEASGLGSRKQGKVFPVATVLKRDRAGLRAGAVKRRVTHFPSHNGLAQMPAAALAAVQTPREARIAAVHRKARGARPTQSKKDAEKQRDQRIRDALKGISAG